MQGVLSYEERLQRAREEARSARLKLDSTVKELQFWRARAEELQGRLQMYEGRKGTEDREIGCSGKDSDAGVRDVSPVSSRCEVREGVEVHGVGDKAEAIEGEEGNVEHVCGEEEMAYVLKEDKVGMASATGDEGEKVDITPRERAYMCADGKGSATSAVGSSSNLVKRMKTRPRMRRPAAVRGSPYRHSYWRRYRKARQRSYKMAGAREPRQQARAGKSDVLDAGRSSGMHWELVGPIPAAMQPTICSVCFAEKVSNCGSDGCRYGGDR